MKPLQPGAFFELLALAVSLVLLAASIVTSGAASIGLLAIGGGMLVPALLRLAKRYSGRSDA